MPKIKPYRDFKASMIYLLRVTGAGTLIHAGDIRKNKKFTYFVKANVNSGATTKLVMLRSSIILN